jgi:hypothetical protein
MNGEFTARVLHLLAEKMEKTLKFYEMPYLLSQDKSVFDMGNNNAGNLKNGSFVANGSDMSAPH